MTKQITIDHSRFDQAIVLDNEENQLNFITEVDMELNAEGYIELTYFHPGRGSKCGVVIHDPDVTMVVNLPDELYDAILQGVRD